MTDEPCYVEPDSSRVCSKGTYGCTVIHATDKMTDREYVELMTSAESETSNMPDGWELTKREYTREEWEEQVSRCLLMILREMRWTPHDLLFQKKIDLGPLIERVPDHALEELDE